MAIPEGVGSSIVKKRPTACLSFGHHIGVGGVSLQSRFEMTGLDAVMLAVIHNGFPQSILPDQSTAACRGKVAPSLARSTRILFEPPVPCDWAAMFANESRCG